MNTKLGVMVAFAVLFVCGSALASTFDLTFSELPVGTSVSTQYAADGVTFGAGTGGTLPVIADDGAMPNSPVLSPAPPFAGDFWINFTGGGATGVSFDCGAWNNIGSTIIDVYDIHGGLLGAITNASNGVDHIDLSGYGTVGSVYFNSFNDPFGADIDNLGFNNVPEPSSMVLLGFGAISLLAYAWRKRRRTA